MSEQKLAAEVRTEFGKGFARRARMANLIPAVIYGHGAEPIHITLPAKATTLAVRTANALLSLDINGEEPPGPRQGHPARPDQADHRAPRPPDRPHRREGHR